MELGECSKTLSKHIQIHSAPIRDHIDSSKIQDRQDVQKDNEPLIPSGWTKYEKFDFMQALKLYGSQSLNEIASAVPTKSVPEVKELLKYYKKRAMNIRKGTNRNLKVINSTSRVPLSMWAKYLMDNYNYKELQTETAKAIRLIAEFEYMPTPGNTANYDFRSVYHALANAMEGKSINNDQNVINIIENCLIETAHCSKMFMTPHVVKESLEKLDLNEKDTGVTTRPTDEDGLAVLRQLGSQKNYNPLNINEKYLKPYRDRKGVAEDNI